MSFLYRILPLTIVATLLLMAVGYVFFNTLDIFYVLQLAWVWLVYIMGPWGPIIVKAAYWVALVLALLFGTGYVLKSALGSHTPKKRWMYALNGGVLAGGALFLLYYGRQYRLDWHMWTPTSHDVMVLGVTMGVGVLLLVLIDIITGE